MKYKESDMIGEGWFLLSPEGNEIVLIDSTCLWLIMVERMFSLGGTSVITKEPMTVSQVEESFGEWIILE